MKRHYLHLWLLLATAFVIFAAASALDRMPTVGGHTLRNSGLAQALTPPHGDIADSIFAAQLDSLALAGAAEPAFPVPVDTAAQTILFIGDSMLEGLSPRMAAYADHNGHTLYSVVWYSSTSEVWGASDKLRHYIDTLRPTYIFVSLGANELFVKDIAAKRRGFVEKIIADIDTIPYVWIGPPNWKDDTGINDLVSGTARRGSFFLSNGMHFDRSSDGAHPTRSSAIEWLDSVMRWMPANAAHPIRMDVPPVQKSRPRRTFVHQPSER